MKNPIRQAVCVLMLSDSDHVVAVSRRNDETLWGLPGGKVDAGETTLEAVIRETSEEIGYLCAAEDLEQLYVGSCGGENGTTPYLVTTYLYRKAAPSLSTLKAEAGLVLKLVLPSTVMRAESSPFAAYNLEVFKAFSAHRQASLAVS